MTQAQPLLAQWVCKLGSLVSHPAKSHAWQSRRGRTAVLTMAPTRVLMCWPGAAGAELPGQLGVRVRQPGVLYRQGPCLEHQ